MLVGSSRPLGCGCLTVLSKPQSDWPVSFPSEVLCISKGIQKGKGVESML